MIATLAALVLFQPVSVEDYFPLTVGTKWHYEIEGQVSSSYVDEVVKTVTVNEKPSFAIFSKAGSTPIGFSAYRVEGDTVYVVAYDERRALPTPQPVLKVADKPVEWSYDGMTQVESQMVKLQYKAASAPKGKRKVLGEERDVVEVRMDATIYELKDLITTRVSQTILYAKGVGMYEMTDTSDFGGQKSVRKVKLVRFEPPK